MTHARVRSGESGFTLVETLLTVVIVGITFVVFVGGMGAAILSADHHRKNATVQATIRNFAEAIKAAAYDPNCATAAASYGNSYSPTPPTRTAAGATFASTSSHVAPSLTATGANSQLLGFYTLATGLLSPASNFAPETADSERWDLSSPGATEADRVTAGFADEAWPSATATGSRTATSTTAVGSITQSLLLAPAAASITRRGVATAATAGATTLSIATPVGTVAGDTMLAQVAVRGGTATSVMSPPGWVLVDGRDNGLSVKSVVYERTATGGTSGTHTWTFASTPEAVGGIVSYGGVSTIYAASVTGMQAWNSGSGEFTSTCPVADGGLQKVFVRVESRDGRSLQEVEVVKRKP